MKPCPFSIYKPAYSAWGTFYTPSISQNACYNKRIRLGVGVATFQFTGGIRACRPVFSSLGIAVLLLQIRNGKFQSPLFFLRRSNLEDSLMMISIIEARVAKENWPLLEQAYLRSSEQTPPGLEQSFLIQNIEEEEVWRIITVWSGMDSLQQIQRSIEAGITPRGALMFQEAHAEPTHSVFEVVQHRVSPSK
jgi:hypothetical protein